MKQNIIVGIFTIVLISLAINIWQFFELKKKDDLILAISGELLKIKQQEIQQAQTAAQREDAINQEQAQQIQLQKQKENLRLQYQSLFKLLSPRDADEFCIGEKIPIKWEAPSDDETVVLTLMKTGYFSKIGEMRNIRGNIATTTTEFLWDQKNEGGYQADAGYTYKIRLDAHYKGYDFSTSTQGTFSIIDCHTN